LAPFLRASESPIAIACLRLFTFLPERPLLSVPAFLFFIARLTFFAAPFDYFRFFAFLAICFSDFMAGELKIVKAKVLRLYCHPRERRTAL